MLLIQILIKCLDKGTECTGFNLENSVLTTPRVETNQFLNQYPIEDRVPEMRRNDQVDGLKSGRNDSPKSQNSSYVREILKQKQQSRKQKDSVSSDSDDDNVDEDVIIDRNLLIKGNKLWIKRNPTRGRTKHLLIYKSLKQLIDEGQLSEDHFDGDQEEVDIPHSIGQIEQAYEDVKSRRPHEDSYNLQLVHVEGWEEIRQNHEHYYDQYALLNTRKRIVLISSIFSWICTKITLNKYFAILMLFLVTVNMVIYITRYYGDYYELYSNIFDSSSYIFFWIYCAEHSVKIIGLGPYNFIKEFWNLYDLINLICYGLYIYGSIDFDLSPLRAMRILIFLAKISRHLAITLRALSEALKFMLEASLVVLILSVFFANLGVHLFKGILQNRCFTEHNGIQDQHQFMCGYWNCPEQNMRCYKSIDNPDVPTNFNNFFYAFAQVIRTITMDNWTSVMYMTMYTMNPFTWIYFILVIFIVGFFAFNLIIAVLKSYYSSIVSNYRSEISQTVQVDDRKPLNLRFIKSVGLYKTIQTLQKVRRDGIENQKRMSLNNQSFSIRITNNQNEQNQLLQDSQEQIQNQHLQHQKQQQQQQQQQRIGPQINTVQRILRKAKSIKERRVENVLSARQQRMLRQRFDQQHGIVANKESGIFNISLKSFLLPNRKFALEKTAMEAKIQNDPQGMYIVNTLKQYDILAWKLEVKYEDYQSHSKLDVLGLQKEQQLKINQVYQQLAKLRQSKLKQYYVLQRYTQRQSQTQSQTLSKSDIFLRGHADSITSVLPKYHDIPIKRSNRLQFQSNDEILDFNLRMSTINSVKILKAQNKDKKGPLQYQKAATISTNRQEYIEFPEWKEGQECIEMNGIRWNYEAVQIIMNREICKIETENKDDLDLYLSFRSFEMTQGYINKNNFSGQDVLSHIPKTTLIKIYYSLNILPIKIWLQGYSGLLLVIQEKAYLYLQSDLVIKLLDCTSVLNLCILSLEGYINDEFVQDANQILTYFLLTEIVIKIGVSDLKRFSNVSSNSLDSFIAMICLIQLVITKIDPIWLQSFSSEVKALRAFKAFMLYRIIKYSQYATRIMKIARRTFASYLSLTFLMFFVIFIYAIIGMQFFVNRLDETKQLSQLHSFNSIGKSWMTVFNVITNDDAYGLLQVATTYQEVWIGLAFYFAMVCVINYIIYGLVMAVLLDAFSSELDNDYSKQDQSELKLKEIGIDQKFVQKESDPSLNSIQDNKYLNNENRMLPSISQDVNSIQSRRTLITRKATVKTQLPENAKYLLKSQKHQFEYFKGIQCGYSLFMFSYNNKFRRYCYCMMKSNVYRIVFNIVICSSVATLIDNSFYKDREPLYTNQLNSYYQYHLLAVNILIGIAYFLEIVSKGVCFEEGAFLSDTWKAFDIIYLLSYYLSFIWSVPFIESAMYVIYLRPLMMINMFESVHGVKTAMTQSLGAIVNVIFVLFLVFFVFNIFGINLFRNKMGYCEDQMNFNVGIEECQNANKRWIVAPYNFDNFTNGLLTLFVVATLDGWGQVMDQLYGPRSFNNQWAAYIFFILFIFIGAMFFMGFFTGVLFSEFQKYTKQLENKHLTSDQSQFVRIGELIINKNPNYSDPPKSFIRKIASRIIYNKTYHKFFIAILITNTIVLSLFYEEANVSYLNSLNLIYQVLSCVFICDTCLKLLSHGIRRYFATTWRMIEFILSLLAFADLLYDNQFNWFDEYLEVTISDSLFLYYRIVFSLRNIRVLLIIQEFKGLARLLRVLEFSMPFLFKILCIQVIVMICYALIGHKLFGHITTGSTIDDQYQNFGNFINAALILFKCTSGDDWSAVMQDCRETSKCGLNQTQCGNNYAIPYFLSYYLFSNIIIMNLFVLALVDQFENFFSEASNVIQTYIENIDHFCSIWCRYTYDTKGEMMHTRFIARFVLDLQEPLGSQAGDNIWDAAKMASDFRVRAYVFTNHSNQQEYVNFNEVLYETMRNMFKTKVFKEGSEMGRLQMKEFDKAINKYMKQQNTKERQGSITKMEGNKYQYQNFNVLQEYINVLVALKTWESYTAKLFSKSNRGLEEYTERTSKSDIDNSEHCIKMFCIDCGSHLSRSELNDVGEQQLNSDLEIYRESKQLSGAFSKSNSLLFQSKYNRVDSFLKQPSSQLDSNALYDFSFQEGTIIEIYLEEKQKLG